MAFGWPHAWSFDFSLLAAFHPSASQSRKEAHFNFVLYIYIRPARRMVQKPCNCAFFWA
jgi:hypothetical protein